LHHKKGKHRKHHKKSLNKYKYKTNKNQAGNSSSIFQNIPGSKGNLNLPPKSTVNPKNKKYLIDTSDEFEGINKKFLNPSFLEVPKKRQK